MYTPDGIVLDIIYGITCLKLLFSNRRVQVIFGMQVVRHAHWCAGLAAGEDVEHAGGKLYPGLWVQLDLRLRVHRREEPAVSRQLVTDCRREQTYIRRGIVCYVNYEICYLVHLN